MIALTREPSGRRASTIGELSSTRRPTRADDAVDDAHQVLVVLERRRQPLEHAAALDVDLLVRVDQDVADRRVAQQRLERPEAEDLVEDVAEDRSRSLMLSGVPLFGDQLEEQRPDFRLGARAVGRRQRLEVQPVEQLPVDVRLQLEVLRPRRLDRGARAAAPRLALARGLSCSETLLMMDSWRRVSRIPRNARAPAPAPASRRPASPTQTAA